MDSEYKKGGAYELPEAGSFPARLVSIIEIGTVQTPFFQKGSFKEGEAPKLNQETGQFVDNKGQVTDAEVYLLDKEGKKMLKYSHQVSLNFEGQNDEKRFYIRNKDLTLSLNERAGLTKIVESILGRKVVEGDTPRALLKEALGKACIIEVSHTEVKDKTYANVTKVAQPMKGMNVLEAKSALTFLTYKDWDKTLFDKLPEFIQNKMRQSFEYKELAETMSNVSASSKAAALNQQGPSTWVDEFGVEHTTEF